MLDRHDVPDSTPKTRKQAMVSLHRRTRGLTIIVLAKLLFVVAVLLLFRVLQVEFGLGVAALVLLHLGIGSGLVVYALRAGLLGRRH